MSNELFTYDELARKEFGSVLCGIDEAGRGPLAGPVFAAAVILPPGIIIDGVNDSKKLSEKTRNLLYDKIISVAESYSVSFVNEEEIDRINILSATMKAMLGALSSLSKVPDIVLVDGSIAPITTHKCRTVIKGDGKSATIAAASIIAKVERDRYMVMMAEKYPHYGFDKHKGYPTKMHYEKIKTYGVCDIHRRSFLKSIK